VQLRVWINLLSNQSQTLMEPIDLLQNYVSIEDFENRTRDQRYFAKDYIKMLQDLDTDLELPRIVEFFFYTNSKAKAKGLKKDLKEMGFDVYGMSKSSKKTFSVVGSSTPILMHEECFQGWVQTMNEIGFANDCLFDGWGMISELGI